MLHFTYGYDSYTFKKFDFYVIEIEQLLGDIQIESCVHGYESHLGSRFCAIAVNELHKL
jgi:hypothetical protein